MGNTVINQPSTHRGKRARHWAELYALLADQEERAQPRTGEQTMIVPCQAVDDTISPKMITENAWFGFNCFEINTNPQYS